MWPARSNRRGNPYNALLADALTAAGASVDELRLSALLRQRYDIVHVHWPEWALQRSSAASTVRRAVPLLAAIAVARRRGARLVWTMHNVVPHDRSLTRTSQWAWRAFRRMVDGTIALSPTVAAAARDAFPDLADRPCAIVPHGHYRDAYPPAPSRSHARLRLELGDGPVALFVGQIRPYKGVTNLVAAFRRFEDPATTLVVAGTASASDQETLRHKAAGDPRIRFQFGYIDPDELTRLITAADVVVLPYTQVSTSGSALLALSFDRPVLAPRTGALADLAVEVGEDWVRLYDGPLDGALLEAALAKPSPNGRAPLDEYDWDRVAQQTLTAYHASARH